MSIDFIKNNLGYFILGLVLILIVILILFYRGRVIQNIVPPSPAPIGLSKEEQEELIRRLTTVTAESSQTKVDTVAIINKTTAPKQSKGISSTDLKRFIESTSK